MAKFSLFLAVVVLVVICAINPARAAPQTQTRAGSKDASKNQFPYVVSLQTSSTYEHVCGGTILNSRWILTAGHCVANRHPGSLVARAGSNEYRVKGDLYEINSVRIHSLFNINTNQNDIAVVRTTYQIVFSNAVKSISISTHQAVQPNLSVTIPAWSYSGLYPGAQVSAKLQYISAKTIQTQTCQQKLTNAGYLPNVFPINVCTESTQNGICRGSEGSPLVSNGSLVGVVSFTKGCNGQLPDVHTRIQPYAQWVAQSIHY